MKNYRKETLEEKEKEKNKIKYSKKNNFINFEYFKNNILKLKIIRKMLGNYSNKLKLNEYIINDINLPSSFEGYKILFISDLHLDIKPNSLDYIKNLKLPEYDLLIFGGDFFDKRKITKEKINDFNILFNHLKTKQNLAVLGNHDSCKLLDLEKKNNLSFLVNETIKINKNNEELLITGIEDITYKKTQYAEKSLIENSSYKICISHNPDFLTISEKYKYNLQLSGHTHGGQIKLPFNFILYPHTKYKFAISGQWKYKSLKGVTTTGFGCATHPLRNIDPEIALIILKK